MSNKIINFIKVLLFIAALFVCFFEIKGYKECKGDYVRGLFWFKCIENTRN